MFGYVKVFVPEMKVREHELYKAVYCSLCRTLGKRYGFAARMTLSYDFTFLALFLMALRDEDITFCQGRCPIHPFKKRMLCDDQHNASLGYAADVAMMLVYHKLEDTICDERFAKRLGAYALRLLYTRDYRRAAARRPLEAQAAKRYMTAQQEAESNPHIRVDAAADPTAMFLSTLAESNLPQEVDADAVARFAYCLGRFIYLADAADDLEEDHKNGSFNPYLMDRGNESIDSLRQYATESLHACVAVCAEVYETLPIKRFDGVLRNVIYHGMPSVIARIAQGKQEDSADE